MRSWRTLGIMNDDIVDCPALCFVLSAILLDDGAHLLLLLLLLLVIHGCRSVCLLDAQWAHLFLFLLTLLIDSII